MGLTVLTLTALVAVACGEDLLAPGDGTCPDYCPVEQLTVVDSVLLDNITSDSTFVGYVMPWAATAMQVYRDSGAAGDVGSRVFFQTLQFSDRLLVAAGDTTRGAVVGTDSFVVEVAIRGRNLGATGLEVGLFRLPVGLGQTATHDQLSPFFTDSTLIGTLPIPDSLESGSVRVRLDSAAFPAFEADSNQAAIGLALRTPSGYVTVGSLEGASAAIVTRYAKVDSGGTPVPRVEAKLPAFDAFTVPPVAPPGPDVRSVGGVPSARTLIRVQLPPRIADSSTVIRATLVLLPSEGVRGAPGDSLPLVVLGVTADVGAKSPLQPLPQDSLALRLSFVPVGTADTVRLDVTDIVIGWVQNPERPRSLMVRAVLEGSSAAELRFAGISAGATRPRLDVTFVPPFTAGGR